jgi:hypothetical protein
MCSSTDIKKSGDLIADFYNKSYYDESFFTEKAMDGYAFGDRKDKPWYGLLKLCNGNLRCAKILDQNLTNNQN